MCVCCCAAGPEEEPIPLVEVHRTPSNGSWLGMVRRRITGSAEDGEAADLTVRLVSLPKERQSGRGSALKVRAVGRPSPLRLPSLAAAR